jgi:asparagine synthase (glutamine-hydrolysing)
MCGIAGYLKNDNTVADPMVLRRMCGRLTHRGPDAYGEFCQGPVGLGHRRLSIIDLKSGQQPMSNEDRSVQVVFNGEIYNFCELRSSLVRRGHQFSSRSDTEVLVHLYEEVGERTPELLNGMFAFAIWDGRRQELFLARDRLGKKPLYYSFSLPKLRFGFASELKALLVLRGFELKISPQAVADFLCLSYVPDPTTICRDVYKLEPAHSLTISQSGHRKRRYWTPDFSEQPEANLADAVEQVRELARDAVRCRMISDVPLGAFLSGGTDSSGVVGLMAEQAPQQVKTFSIGFSDKRFDELEYARIAAGHNRTDHHEEVVTLSFLEMLGKLVEHFDEPFGDSSAIPMLYLSRMTRRHVTVALCGDGADELFAGYRRYYYGALEERLRSVLPAWFRRSVIQVGGRYYPKLDFLPQAFRAKSLLVNLAQELGDAYFTSMTAFRDEGLRSVMSPEMYESLDGYNSRQVFRGRFEAIRHLDPLQQMQRVDLETYLPGDILVKADRTTMAYSLESRSPWLDYRMAELACRLPSWMKMHGRVRKYMFPRPS